MRIVVSEDYICQLWGLSLEMWTLVSGVDCPVVRQLCGQSSGAGIVLRGGDSPQGWGQSSGVGRVLRGGDCHQAWGLVRGEKSQQLHMGSVVRGGDCRLCGKW